MDFGIVHAKIDEIGYITHAENLGYSHCWVTDSQMIRSNCWAVLALAAQQTRRMRLGTGVNVPGLRLAPVAANGIATINRLAPGRCFIGLGTGHTAMRTLGQKPMRLGPFKEYVQTVRALLRGEEVDYTLNGETHPIRFQMREHRFIDLDHPIPVYIAGFGPKAQALAGELGDGLISGLPRGGTVPEMLANARRGAQKAGRALPDGLPHRGDGQRGAAAAGRGGQLRAHHRGVRRGGDLGAALPGRAPPGDRRGAARLRAAGVEGLSRLAQPGAARDPAPAPARQPLQLRGSGGGALPHAGADRGHVSHRRARAHRGAPEGARRARG